MLQRVREFSPEYLEEVAFIHSCVLDGWSKNGLSSELENSLSHSFVLLGTTGEVVAFCSFSVCDTAELAFVCTHPKHRQMGYGYALLQEVIAELGVNNIVLEVRKGNVSAQRLYQKLGFVDIGTRKGMYQGPPDDGVIMELKNTLMATDNLSK